MSFVTWLALPVGITLIVSLIMVLLNHLPRTNTHQDIESFAAFRGALARQMAEPPPPGTVPLSSSRAMSSSPRTEPPADLVAAPAAQAVASNATIVEDRHRRDRAGVAVSRDR